MRVGAGKDKTAGVQVKDALCWAGSSYTTRGAPLLGKLPNDPAENKASPGPGPAGYSIPRYPDDKFPPPKRIVKGVK